MFVSKAGYYNLPTGDIAEDGGLYLRCDGGGAICQVFTDPAKIDMFKLQEGGYSLSTPSDGIQAVSYKKGSVKDVETVKPISNFEIRNITKQDIAVSPISAKRTFSFKADGEEWYVYSVGKDKSTKFVHEKDFPCYIDYLSTTRLIVGSTKNVLLQKKGGKEVFLGDLAATFDVSDPNQEFIKEMKNCFGD